MGEEGGQRRHFLVGRLFAVKYVWERVVCYLAGNEM